MIEPIQANASLMLQNNFDTVSDSTRVSEDDKGLMQEWWRYKN